MKLNSIVKNVSSILTNIVRLYSFHKKKKKNKKLKIVFFYNNIYQQDVRFKYVENPWGNVASQFARQCSTRLRISAVQLAEARWHHGGREGSGWTASDKGNGASGAIAATVIRHLHSAHVPRFLSPELPNLQLKPSCQLGCHPSVRALRFSDSR